MAAEAMEAVPLVEGVVVAEAGEMKEVAGRTTFTSSPPPTCSSPRPSRRGCLLLPQGPPPLPENTANNSAFAIAINSFNNPMPGMLSIAAALFAAKPAVPDAVDDWGRRPAAPSLTILECLCSFLTVQNLQYRKTQSN